MNLTSSNKNVEREMLDFQSFTVGGIKYPATIGLQSNTRPLDNEELLLAGAGLRGIAIPGAGTTSKTLHFTAIGIYVAPEILDFLSQWRGRTAAELLQQDEFFIDVIRAPLEKLARVVMLRNLTGFQFAEKSGHNAISVLQAAGKCGESELVALQEWHSIFESRDCPVGSSLLLRIRPTNFSIVFVRDDSIPADIEAASTTVVHSRLFGEAFLETILGNPSVSPAARTSFAMGMASLLSINAQTELSRFSSKENCVLGPPVLHGRYMGRDTFVPKAKTREQGILSSKNNIS